MSLTWRLLTSPPASGRRNMAVDEAILEAVAAGQAPPTLRLYVWNPPCLSLGHAQSAEVVDGEALAAAGWESVRRPTGGRALLHTDELTYSIAGLESTPDLAGGVLLSYRQISRGLHAGLTQLGLRPDPPAAAITGDFDRLNPVCFEVPSAYEITVGGKKLIGSAQLRRRGSVLQHGSLPLFGDLTRVVRGLRYPDEEARRQAAERLLQHATTVEQLLGRIVTFDEAAAALVSGFAEALGWSFSRGELTPEERSAATRLEASLDRQGAASSRPRSPAATGDPR